MNFKVATPLLAIGLLGLTACGGSTRTSTTAPAAADIVVRAQDGIRWNASEYTASAADGTVTLYAVNDSGLAHNLHIVDADGNDVAPLIDLPSKGSSGTDELELAAGEYRIICKIAGHSGTMNAKLTITP
jgi:plastocyanin